MRLFLFGKHLKKFLYLTSLIFVITLPVHSQVKSIASGNWNNPSIWEGGMPTSTTTVTIQKGFTVYIDTWARCYAAEVKLEDGASLIFDSVEFAGSSLTVYGNISTGRDCSIKILSTELNSSAFLYVIGSVSIDSNSEFRVELDTAAFINIDLSGLDIKSGGYFGCYFNNRAGNVSLNWYSVVNSGLFEVVNTTDTQRTIVVGGIINKGIMRFIAIDPDPSNTNKPDPPTVERKLVLLGSGDSSLVTLRAGDYVSLPRVGLELINVKVDSVGSWDRINTEGIPLYGIGFVGTQVSPIDGRYDIVSVYNCDIANSPDVGVFFENCVRINSHWGQIGVSSNVIRNCATAGVWFMENVNKCDLKYNKIYGTVGGNVGYGVLLGMPIRYISSLPVFPQGFANENYIYKNEIYNNKLRGIYVYYSHKNLIDTNKCYGHIEEGISLKNAVKNVVILNECYNNGVHGIALDGVFGDPTSGSKQNYIGNNKCFNNNNGGLRVRYNSNQNIFVNNISSGNARTGFASHSSVGNLLVNEEYYNNAWGDVYIEGEENTGYISQIWMKNCLLGSTTEFVNTPEKQEFTKENSWVISQCHDRTPGLTRIWGQFSFPDSYHTWHTNDTIKFVHNEPLYTSKSHGWNTVVNSYDTAMLRYDDGGVDGPEGSNDITSVTISSTTKTEVWIITYRTSDDKWLARGTVSGVQTNLVQHDTDFVSDNGEVRFRITHRVSPISPGEQYVFVTIKGSEDQGVQKIVNLCDFSDPSYIGAKMLTNSPATVEIAGVSGSPVIFTRKLAEDKNYQMLAGTEDFYYGISLGGTINRIEYASFTFLNQEGLVLNSIPLQNTKNVFIARLKPSNQTSYITANSITHTFDNIMLDTTTATLGVVSYGVKATNSVLTFRNYTRPFLPDKLMNSIIYWDPTIVWSGLQGFTEDGVEPNAINRFNSVEFTIKYTDLNNNPPTTVQVWVDLDDDLIFSTTEQFGMRLKPGVGNDGDYTNGEIYHFVLSNINYPPVPSAGRSGGKIKYRFYAENPYSITVATYPFNLYSVTNNVLSLNEATGVGTQVSTFSVKGTPPVVFVETPLGEQTDLVRINYTLYDYDDKPEPFNYCSVKVEYFDGTTWKTATRHDSSEPVNNLVATLNGTQHYFIWDSRKDLPNKDVTTSVRITPSDEDGEGSPVQTASFNVDNIVAVKLVFTTPQQELTTGTTSSVCIVEAQDEVGNKDVDINNIPLYLVTTSTGGVFLDINNVIVSSVNIVYGEARFKYRDELKGFPVITVSASGLSSAQQVFYITKGVSIVKSSVSVLLAGEVNYAELKVGTTANIVITLRDIDGEPISGKEVSVYSTGSDFILTQPISPTNTEGKTYANFYTTKVGDYIITAKVKDENLTLVSSSTLKYYSSEPSPVNSVIQAGKILAVVGETITVYVQLKDEYGNIVSSSSPIGKIPVTVKVKNQPAEDVLTYVDSNYIDVNGIVRVSYIGNTEGEKVFTAETDKIVLVSTAVVRFTSGDITPPTVVSIVPSTTVVVTESISKIVINLYDISGISTSTVVKLYKPDNTLVSGNIVFLDSSIEYNFSKLDLDGQYRIEIVAYDTKGNVGVYNFYFTLQTRDPQKVFNSTLVTYPNPSTTGKVVFRYSLLNNSKVKIKIYNILGELIWEKELDKTAGNDLEDEWLCENVDRNKVGSGVYVVNINVEDNVVNKKFNTIKKIVVIKK